MVPRMASACMLVFKIANLVALVLLFLIEMLLSVLNLLM